LIGLNVSEVGGVTWYDFGWPYATQKFPTTRGAESRKTANGCLGAH